jgi:hypothetical protein
VKALKEKERQEETQFITKIGGKTSLGPVILLCKIFIRCPREKRIFPEEKETK